MRIKDKIIDKKYKIGIVEDKTDYLNFIQNELQKDMNISSIISWNNAEDFLKDKTKENIDILFLDIALPGLSGIDVLLALNKSEYSFKVVVITTLNSEEVIFKALKAGAVGYIHKAELQNIRETAFQVLNGGGIISPTIALKVLNHFTTEKNITKKTTSLSERELQVLNLLVTGYSGKETADFLNLSPNTIRNHVQNIYAKLKVKNRAQLIKEATANGLI